VMRLRCENRRPTQPSRIIQSIVEVLSRFPPARALNYRQLGPDIQWLESYVTEDKTFCVYLAKDEDIIRKRAELSGFPATKITEVRKTIDPTTERSD
jgi:hypothetical protein